MIGPLIRDYKCLFFFTSYLFQVANGNHVFFIGNIKFADGSPNNTLGKTPLYHIALLRVVFTTFTTFTVLNE